MKHMLIGAAYLGLAACSEPSNSASEAEKTERRDANIADRTHSESAPANDESVGQILKSGDASMAAACGSESVKDYLLSKVDQEVAPFSDMLFVKAYEPEIPYEITSDDIQAAKEDLDPPTISAVTVRQVLEKIGKVECDATLTVSSDVGSPRSYRIEYDLRPIIGETGYLVSSNLDQPRGAWRVAIQGYAKAIAKARALKAATVGATSADKPLG